MPAHSLRENQLGTEGWCAIFAALRDNKENKIESWDLSDQDINGEIAKTLAEYVSVSSVLTDLDLRYNSIGAEGAKALAKALSVNRVLNTLDVELNELGEEGEQALRDAVKGRDGFELLV